MEQFEVFCRYEDYAARLNFYIFRSVPDGGREVCVDLGKLKFKAYREKYC